MCDGRIKDWGSSSFLVRVGVSIGCLSATCTPTPLVGVGGRLLTSDLFNGDYLHGPNRWQVAGDLNPDGTVRIPNEYMGYRLGLTMQPNRETIGHAPNPFGIHGSGATVN